MQRKSPIIFLLLSATAAAFLSGCGEPPEPSPASLSGRFEGVAVRVACPDEAAKRLVEEYGAGWAHREGATLTVTVRDARDEEALRAAGADVWVLPAPELPRWAAAGKLTPIPESLTRGDPSYDWRGLLSLYRVYLLAWDREVYALPLLGDALVCFYRADLFEDPTHRGGFNGMFGRPLKAPETWEEFADIADYFHRARVPDKEGHSLPPLPEDPRALDSLFYAVAAPYARRGVSVRLSEASAPAHDLFSFHFDEQKGSPRINGPGFVRALELLRRMQAFRPAGPAAEPWRAFRDGKAVLCIGQARLLGEFQAGGSAVRGRVGVCAVPGSDRYYDYKTGQEKLQAGNRVPYQGAGAYLLAVPRESRTPRAAFDLLTELTDPRTARQVVIEPRWGGGAVRLAHLDEHWDSYRLETRQEQDALKAALRQALRPDVRNPVRCLRVPDEWKFSAALVEELRRALAPPEEGAKEENAAQVLKRVAQRWEEIIGPDRDGHRRAYQISLGLQAR